MNSQAHFPYMWRKSPAGPVFKITLLILTAVLCSPTWAVDCTSLIIAMRSQAEVDSFQNTYGPCDRVLTLYVEGDEISNLDGLSALTDIGSSLYIENNPALTNVDGFSSLIKVGRNLSIWNNSFLANLDGFSTLTSVGGNLAIRENSALKNINGLSALTGVGGSLAILENAILTDVDGLSALTSVGQSDKADQRSLLIENNAALTNLDGLSSLSGVGSYTNGYTLMTINNNTVLANVDGLSALTDIWGDLQITNNTSLSSIDGLSSLTRVLEITIRSNASLNNVNGLSALTNVSHLLIRDNENLTNVDGLSAVTAVWNDLGILNNAKLSQCTGVFRLVDQWDDATPGPGGVEVPDVGGELFIMDNLTACNSVTEILANTIISRINAGLNDAWYDPVTDGQGFFITVFPDLGAVSLAWFTYDTELPADGAPASLGDAGHRWLTAAGPIVDNQVMMDIEMTSGGIFDTATQITRTDPPGSDGTIILTFNSCNSGIIEYDIPSINKNGIVPIQRIANDNIVICEALNAD